MVRERHQVEKEIYGEQQSTADEDDPVYPGSVMHVGQQTDECGTTLDIVLKENAMLKNQLAQKTLGIATIKGNDE